MHRPVTTGDSSVPPLGDDIMLSSHSKTTPAVVRAVATMLQYCAINSCYFESLLQGQTVHCYWNTTRQRTITAIITPNV